MTLSGPFDTAQLPRIASDPVTVTVARTVAPGFEAQYVQWTEDVVAMLRKFHGCLGVGVLEFEYLQFGQQPCRAQQQSDTQQQAA